MAPTFCFDQTPLGECYMCAQIFVCQDSALTSLSRHKTSHQAAATLTTAPTWYIQTTSHSTYSINLDQL